MGYGAMQLAGPHVFGEPGDPAEARAVLREALALGVDHIDTSDYYGPHVTNRLIREAPHPYPDGLTLVWQAHRRSEPSGLSCLRVPPGGMRSKSIMSPVT